MSIKDTSASMILWTIATFLTVYVGTRVVWFLYFSPLAKFPGPKLAAVTRWYEFYYGVVLGGKYIFKIKELHERYGPIIRITPYELHIDDPEFYDTLYSLTDRREKWTWIQARFDVPDAFISTPSHDLHRMRRAPLQSMFSKQKILNFEPYVQETLDKFTRTLREYEKDGRPVRLDHAASAFSGDIVSEYAFAKSLNSLDSKDYTDALQDAFMTAAQTAHVSLHFQWIIPIMNSLPENLVLKLQPKLERLFHLKGVLSGLIEDIRYDRNDNYKTANHPTIFRELLDSKLPDSEKTPRRLTQEGQAFVGAGFSTTAWAICVGCVHILSDPEVEQKLRTELRNAIPDPSVSPRWLDLEKLPYLRSCIYESIRLSYGAVSRLQRIDPLHDLHYKQWTIPAGTPVSQSHYIVNHSEKIFPDSFKFRPERWIEGGVKMDKFLLSFSKGTRMCIGINLAYAELYKMFAFLFRHVNMELYETDLSDVALGHDWFVPGPKLDSKGIYLKILNVQ